MPERVMTKCGQCVRLAARSGRTEHAYIKAMGLVVAAYDTQPAVEYNRLRVAWEERRIDAEAARLEYERHRRGHDAN